jgi:hypothetical protein
VIAAGVDHPVPGDLPQPRIEWDRPVTQIAIQAAVGFRERVLDQVGRVQAGAESAVEADGDHAVEPLAMAVQQPAAGGAVAGRGGVE